jgi:hypothetical protein
VFLTDSIRQAQGEFFHIRGGPSQESVFDPIRNRSEAPGDLKEDNLARSFQPAFRPAFFPRFCPAERHAPPSLPADHFVVHDVVRYWHPHDLRFL